MKPRRRHARPAASKPAALLLLLLLLLAPAAATAQRRRSAPRKPAPPAPAAPAASPSAAASETQRQEVERPFDTSVAADSYVAYVEVRGLGQLARTKEVRMALDAFRLMGGAPQDVTDLIDFVTANEETLSTVRVVSAVMPVRAGLPDGITALQFPTPEAARAFEPKLRALFDNMGEAFGQPGAPAATPKGRGASRRLRRQKKAPPVVMKRAGSWLYLAPGAFTFKSLKGDGTYLLADNVRLQSFRSRLASESVFGYYETALWRRAWQLQYEESMKKQEELERAASATRPERNPSVQTDPALIPGEPPIPYGDPKNNQPPPDDEMGAEFTIEERLKTGEASTPTQEPSPTADDEEEAAELAEAAERAEAEKNGVVGVGTAGVEREAAPKSAEERAARAMMGTLLNGIFGGMTREPEATAVGLNLEGDHIVARLLVSRDADAPNNIIPFFPNVVAGPAVVPETLSVAPADSEVFVAASFDWARIYDSLIETMNRPTRLSATDDHGGDGAQPREAEETAAEMRPASAEKGVEAMEKFFGFRLKEDLLPALGGEVAVSIPVEFFEGRRFVVEEADADPEKKDGATAEKKARAGAVAIIALNNPEAVRKVMPLALAALGMGGPRQAAPPERRKGFDVHDLGGAAYAFVNNFLVVGESAPAVRHVVDAYASNQTLAASTRFRDSVAWQEHQRLALGYLSDRLMARMADTTKKMTEGSTDPLVLAALAQMDVPAATASYAATDKGDALLHELRLPVGLLKVIAGTSIIQLKEAPVIGNENFAEYALRRVHGAQGIFRKGKGKGRFGSLEELIEAKIIEKDFVVTAEYAIEVRASGDKFSATATPKNYGTTGRRSFYIDETGVLRAANHKGEPATADDPPVDQ